jgi:hypothetical protein
VRDRYNSLFTSQSVQLIPSPIIRSRSWRTTIPPSPYLRVVGCIGASCNYRKRANTLFMLAHVVLARRPYLAGPSPQLITCGLSNRDCQTAPSFPAWFTSCTDHVIGLTSDTRLHPRLLSRDTMLGRDISRYQRGSCTGSHRRKR